MYNDFNTLVLIPNVHAVQFAINSKAKLIVSSVKMLIYPM